MKNDQGASEGIEIVEIGGRPRDIDASIAPLVRALNAAGIATVASCSGHGNRPGNIALADGRELVIMPTFESARRLDQLFPDIHGNLPRAISDALDAAREAIGPEQVFYRAGQLVGISHTILDRQP